MQNTRPPIVTGRCFQEKLIQVMLTDPVEPTRGKKLGLKMGADDFQMIRKWPQGVSKESKYRIRFDALSHFN